MVGLRHGARGVHVTSHVTSECARAPERVQIQLRLMVAPFVWARLQ